LNIEDIFKINNLININ